jgi:hypothetical protein
VRIPAPLPRPLALTERVEQAERRALAALLAVRAIHRHLAFHERAREGTDPDQFCDCCSQATAYAGLLGRPV